MQERFEVPQNSDELKIYVNRSKGILAGNFVGDGLGVHKEYALIDYKGITQEAASKLSPEGKGGPTGEFYNKPGQWSDDAAQSACLADALEYMRRAKLEKFPSAYFMDRIADWYTKGLYSGLSPENSFPSVGLGKTVGKMFFQWSSLAGTQAEINLSFQMIEYVGSIPKLPSLLRLPIDDLKSKDKADEYKNLETSKKSKAFKVNVETIECLLENLNSKEPLSEPLNALKKDLLLAEGKLKKIIAEAKANPAAFSYQQTISGAKDETDRNKKLEFANGNASIMRLGACALYAKTLEEAMELAYRQSIVTTPGRQSADTSRFLTFLIWQARHSRIKDPKELIKWLLSKENLDYFIQVANSQVLPTMESGYTKEGIVTLAPQVEALCKSRIWELPMPEKHAEEGIINKKDNDVDRGYYGAYVMDNIPLVLHALNHSESFEMLLATLVLAGGDADSNGAVAGQLGGAIYGFDAIPWRWMYWVGQHTLSPRVYPESKNNFLDLNNTIIERLIPESKEAKKKYALTAKEAQYTQDDRFVYLQFPSEQQKQVEEYLAAFNIPSIPCRDTKIGQLFFPQPEVVVEGIIVRMEKAVYEKFVKESPEIYPMLSNIEKETRSFKTYPVITVAKMANKEETCFLEFDNHRDAYMFASYYDTNYKGDYKKCFPNTGPLGKGGMRRVSDPIEMSSGKAIYPMTGEQYKKFCNDNPGLNLPQFAELAIFPQAKYEELRIKTKKEAHSLPGYPVVEGQLEAQPEVPALPDSPDKAPPQAEVIPVPEQPQKAANRQPQEEQPADITPSQEEVIATPEKPQKAANRQAKEQYSEWAHVSFGADYDKAVRDEATGNIEFYYPAAKGEAIYNKLKQACKSAESFIKYDATQGKIIFEKSKGTKPGSLGVFESSFGHLAINFAEEADARKCFEILQLNKFPAVSRDVLMAFLGSDAKKAVAYIHPNFFNQVQLVDELSDVPHESFKSAFKIITTKDIRELFYLVKESYLQGPDKEKKQACFDKSLRTLEYCFAADPSKLVGAFGFKFMTNPVNILRAFFKQTRVEGDKSVRTLQILIAGMLLKRVGFKFADENPEKLINCISAGLRKLAKKPKPALPPRKVASPRDAIPYPDEVCWVDDSNPEMAKAGKMVAFCKFQDEAKATRFAKQWPIKDHADPRPAPSNAFTNPVGVLTDCFYVVVGDGRLEAYLDSKDENQSNVAKKLLNFKLTPNVVVWGATKGETVSFCSFHSRTAAETWATFWKLDPDSISQIDTVFKVRLPETRLREFAKLDDLYNSWANEILKSKEVIKSPLVLNSIFNSPAQKDGVDKKDPELNSLFDSPAQSDEVDKKVAELDQESQGFTNS
ncbi:ADP-ribosyl-[dinitrogen reductase] glycohydrolase [Legionella massiliensis]|uniref:ADP-ribosyl-[dinitrogen reductase] glycohydrolase n=1 Tax=Legionella massiliensis TaxID=1034943 RepID=A0A078KW01_9GAMM|nr:ADP-ribosylglycohydrolase family protein [Legionella massiliensis]CDZ77187.1 ADP-ribosyl-[dinitrogen reductase] glycohydrolase [Legionella massiliensis]CEE12925.1 ADP-ribosyl-[dinitrogen reductase] glycohydrolase [Legionella massiliensis]